MTRTIEIDQTITVGNLAQQLELPVTNLVSRLVKNGVMITLNERIDFDTVTLLIEELGLDVRIKPKSMKFTTIQADTTGLQTETRPPIVAVMGHVDHGKTSLLDKIKGSDQVSIEAGGITQHISAIQVRHNKRLITFLDTPGHEAFAAVREHGAMLTDLVVLIVAADSGVQDQTLEAIRFALKSSTKIIVAITKIDKEDANVHLVKQQLSENNILVEDLGGSIIAVEISSKTGQGINELLDMILLVADIEELKAVCEGQATGIIIESAMKKGLGATATVLVQAGILSIGDYIVAGDAWGKIRILQDSSAKKINQASASSPAIVCGFKKLPEFGMNFQVINSEKKAKNLAKTFSQDNNVKLSGMNSSELLRIIDRRTGISEYKILIKSDVRGSLTSIVDGIKSLETDEVSSKIINSGVGIVSENDINTARIAQADIYCFNLELPISVKRLASQAGVEIKSYSVIYELLEDVKLKLQALLIPEIKTIKLGQLSIKGVFKTTKTEIICGGEVIEGKLTLPALVKILRDGANIGEAEVVSLAKASSEVQEISLGSMGGIRLKTKTKINLKENDILDFYITQTQERKL